MPPGSLHEQLPPFVALRLAETGVREAEVLFATHTDVDLVGNYNPAWLVVTSRRLLVLAGLEDEARITDLAIDTIQEVRIEPGVGAGLLQVKIEGVYVDLMRYSNRAAYRFERLVELLETWRRQEPVLARREEGQDPRRCPTCGLMLDAPGELCPRCVRRGAALFRMLKLMRPYRGRALAMLGFLLFGVALDLVSPQLTRYLVDNVLPARPGAGAAHDAGRELVIVVGILALVQVLRMAVNVVNGRLASGVGTRVTADMRARMVEHLQKLSLGFYDRQQVGALVGRVAYDTEAIHGFVWQLTGGFILQLLMVIGVWVMMFTIDTRLALLALLPSPLIMGGTVLFWRRVYPRYYRYWDASSKQAGTLTGMLGGIRVVKAFNQERHEFERFQGQSERLRSTRHGVDAGIATFNGIVGVLFQLGGWLVWYFGGLEVLRGELTLGELMAFFGYLWMFYGPLAALPQLTSWLTQVATQTSRIFEVLDTPPFVPENASAVPLRPMQGSVRFAGVSFAYEPHAPVLRNVDLEVRAGEMLGIVGPSGAGKTTVVNLISRFYDVSQGAVTIDGVDVRRIAKDDLRSQIGVVLQEPFLFRGSLRDNVTYGRPDASPEALIAAARAANCHDFILRHPHAYDTWIGERGSGLSGGERQRLSIARALLTDPRILILDEATSNVDAESEALIQRALAHLVRGRTTIAIAHRLSTLRSADRILVLERGRVVESGTHRELASRPGVYRRLLRLQGIDPHAADRVGEASQDAYAHLTGHTPRWLEPERTRLERGPHDTLRVRLGDEPPYAGAFALRCMPVHEPSGFVALRFVGPSGGELEIGLVRRLDEWPDEARRLILESLARRYFVHTVHALRGIELVSNHLTLRVDTDLGPMELTTRWQPDRIQDYGARGKLILDVDENRYVIPDMTELPSQERELFERYVYW